MSDDLDLINDTTLDIDVIVNRAYRAGGKYEIFADDLFEPGDTVILGRRSGGDRIKARVESVRRVIRYRDPTGCLKYLTNCIVTLPVDRIPSPPAPPSPASFRVTKEQMPTIWEAAAPLVQWLKDHAHPHVTIHVSQGDFKVTEDVAKGPLRETLINGKPALPLL